jgi:hypothetical protein
MSGTYKSNPPAKEADEALRQKAFDLLKSVAGQLGGLQSAENRARIGANVADSLWQRDEERARALFVSVQDDINAGLQTRAGDAATRIAAAHGLFSAAHEHGRAHCET